MKVKTRVSQTTVVILAIVMIAFVVVARIIQPSSEPKQNQYSGLALDVEGYQGDNLDDTVWAWIETTAAGEEDAERIFDSWVEWRWGR